MRIIVQTDEMIGNRFFKVKIFTLKSVNGVKPGIENQEFLTFF
jgi:hypothetical protein